MEPKCKYTTKQLLEIFEQYKETSAHMVSEMALRGQKNKYAVTELHSSLIKAFEGFDFSDLTLSQADKLGISIFNDYDDETQVDFLMLFPLWMFPIIPTNIELTNIFGIKLPPFKNVTKGSDTRNGLLAYGMMNYQFTYKRVLVEKYDNGDKYRN